MHLYSHQEYSHGHLKSKKLYSSSEATKQIVWLRKILEDMGKKEDKATILFCDYKSAIAMSKNSVFHSCTKHINLKYHFIWEAVEDDEILMKHVKTKIQVANIFTKALSSEKFIYLGELLGMSYKSIKDEC